MVTGGSNTGFSQIGESVDYSIPYGRLRLSIDLTTFAGGIYGGFSNQYVGAGGGLLGSEEPCVDR